MRFLFDLDYYFQYKATRQEAWVVFLRGFHEGSKLDWHQHIVVFVPNAENPDHELLSFRSCTDCFHNDNNIVDYLF